MFIDLLKKNLVVIINVNNTTINNKRNCLSTSPTAGLYHANRPSTILHLFIDLSFDGFTHLCAAWLKYLGMRKFNQ